MHFLCAECDMLFYIITFRIESSERVTLAQINDDASLQETYGEDPYLTGTLTMAFLRGIHGQHPRYMRATAGCTAFDLYAGPENIPILRFDFDAKVLTRVDYKL